VPGAILLAALALSVGGGWAVPRVAAAEPLRARQLGTGLPAATAIAGLTSGNVTIGGSGFGHGVGMSQYGALGMARAGTSVGGILTHYYSGTTVTGYPDDVDLKVNVVDRGTRVTLTGVPLASGGGDLRLITSGGVVLPVPAGGTAVVTLAGATLSITVTAAPGAVPHTVTTAALTVRWSGGRGLSGPASLLRVVSRTADGTSTSGRTRSYRWGQLRLLPVRRSDSDGTVRSRIEGVVQLSLHGEYLLGVAEMPSSWPAAALQAQVVAARNYALAAYQHGTSAACGGCNLWDDTRSQVYSGWAKESEKIGSVRYGDRWRSAVTATQTSSTRSLVVLYRGELVTAYFSSSSGGRTRDAASAWGSAVPYLRSVPDPWSVDPAVNPGYAHWSKSVPVGSLISLFGLRNLARIGVSDRDAGGAAVSITATSADGTARTLSGSAFRSRLGLPAPWVTSLQLSAPPTIPPTPLTSPTPTPTASTSPTPTASTLADADALQLGPISG